MQGRRVATVAAGVVVVLALVAVVVVLTSGGGGGDDGADDAVAIRLEPIGATTPDPFTGDLSLGRALGIALPGVPPLGSGVGAALAGVPVGGEQPGLYGGTRNQSSCDKEQLVEFLTDPANRDKAEAWAAVHGIEVDDIARFLAKLTPVRLRFDTLVTNHGFRAGRANPIPAVLEAGTAVLVDDRGVPRAKCACGNPLLEPQGDGSGEVANPRDAWEGFGERPIAVAEPSRSPIEAFVLVDERDGSLFERPAGTDGDEDRDVEATSELCEDFAASPTCEGLVEVIAVPEVTGSSPDAARRLLAQLGFTGEVSERQEPFDDVAAGVVAGSEPPTGTSVPSDTPIVLIVSSGPPTGSTSASTSSTRVPPTIASTTSTTTRRSSTTSTSTTTTSTTTTTSSTTTTTAPPRTTVPNVVGLTESQAVARLSDAGLEAVSVKEPSPNHQNGTVFAQSPQAGAQVPRGSTVTIRVADNPQFGYVAH